MIPREHRKMLSGRGIAAATYLAILDMAGFGEDGRPTKAKTTLGQLVVEVFGHGAKRSAAKYHAVRRAVSELESMGLIKVVDERQWREKQLLISFEALSAWFDDRNTSTLANEMQTSCKRDANELQMIDKRVANDREPSTPHKTNDGALLDFYFANEMQTISKRDANELQTSRKRDANLHLYRDIRDYRDKETTETLDTLSSKQPPADAGEESAQGPKETVSLSQEHMPSLAEKEPPKQEPPHTPPSPKSRDETPYTEIVAAWNEMARANGLLVVQKLTEQRKRAIRARWREEGGERDPDEAMRAIRAVFERVGASDFLTGRKEGSTWRATFDWTLKPEKWVRVAEGVYDNRPEARPQKRLPRAFESLMELAEDYKAGRVKEVNLFDF